MNQNTKSATTAGLLGIFLGAFGAHNWYLGEKGKGIAHVCLMGSGLLVEIVAAAVLPNVFSLTMLIQLGWLLTILSSLAALAMSASGIWGLVEGIIIISQGDAGLASKGYAVANPVQPINQGYGYQQGYNNMGYNNYGPQQGYGQPMNGGYGPQGPMNGGMPMGQPMPGQPMGPNQPMNNGMPMDQNMGQPMDQGMNNNMGGFDNGQ